MTRQTNKIEAGGKITPRVATNPVEHAKLAFCEKTTALKHQIEQNFLEIGHRLMGIRAKEMWKGRWESYEDYLENDLKMTPATASKLVTIYQTFVEDHKLSPEKLALAGWTNLYTVIPLIENKEDAEEWLEKATTLTRTDLGRCIEERKTGREMVECEHDFEQIVMQKCTKCHIKIVKYEAKD